MRKTGCETISAVHNGILCTCYKQQAVFKSAAGIPGVRLLWGQGGGVIINGTSYVYGVEYKGYPGQPFQAVDNHNVPCAVCYASMSVAVTTIPAKTRGQLICTPKYSCQPTFTNITPYMSVLTKARIQYQEE